MVCIDDNNIGSKIFTIKTIILYTTRVLARKRGFSQILGGRKG